MKNELERNLRSVEQFEFQEDLERCTIAIDNLEIFESDHDFGSAWTALTTFHLAILLLEKIPTTKLHPALENSQLNEKLTTLLKKIKQSDIFEFEEKHINEKTILPDISEAKKMIEAVKGDILRVEIYLSNVLEVQK